ncbi:hypothetical protein H839_10318 [Parageobacillus genomosp. 1]|uniref:DUF5680 domain-containing protein n=1 Tax=Parageobacillus genomosp. 1 TaxID=1295642 RepID=A0ABC9VEV7_9BACL|nr:DUF5680 domain-containing protein [Parageobacillus genomosp. 1]EZP76984.1 hypothetical protein H839_10318 [Parageobacillus genomosp. 1]
MERDTANFIDFLVEAKKRTYASETNNASVRPLWNGAKQLEYQKGDYLYRDIYFGSVFFAGQEVVEEKERPVWSMVYSGGIVIPSLPREQVASVYAFLRKALRLVDMQAPYRGPRQWQDGPYTYQNDYEGTWERFYGEERILIAGEKVYKLRYSGGMIIP